MHGTFGEGGPASIDFRTGQDGQLSGGAGFSRCPTRFVVVRGNGGNRPLGSGDKGMNMGRALCELNGIAGD